MYVCICNGHRERDIREAALSGMTCARKIYRHLGKPVRCGRCLEVAGKVVDEALRNDEVSGRGEAQAIRADSMCADTAVSGVV